jgi:hypothetical protein
MSSKFWFVPAPGYSGPPIELVCGRHTKSGRFIPKNVKLTPGISRLSKRPRTRIRMVGDNGLHLIGDIYLAAMAEKRRRHP